MINFAAGPSALPSEIKKALQKEWSEDVSFFEISHYSSKVRSLYAQLCEKIKKHLQAPSSWHVLFLPGGARLHMASILYNIGDPQKRPSYIDTGHWAQWAYKEADRLGYHPFWMKDLQTAPPQDPRFVFYVDNETLNGSFQRYERSNTITAPVIVDMTSSLLCEPVNFEHIDVILASCQKTLGLPGTSFLLIRPDVLEAQFSAPRVLCYKEQLAHQSMVSTPSVLNLWVADHMLSWLEQQNIQCLRERRREMAHQIYKIIDQSECFYNQVPEEKRSTITLTFHFHDLSLREEFEGLCQEKGFVGLIGHKLYTPGYRLSLYPAVVPQDLEAFIAFLKQYADNKKTGLF